MTTKTFGEQAIVALLFKEGWPGLGNRHERRDDGIWVVPPLAHELQCLSDEAAAARVAHPLGDLDRPALRFPFTATEFRAFCKSHPMFEWDFIESPFFNDDDSLDGPAIAKLAQRSQPAAELVRLLLTGAESLDMQPTEARAKAEKATAKQDRLLREILVGLGISLDAIPRDKGGKVRPDTPKSKARVVALAPEYAAQGFTARTFRAAWERLPKID